MSLFSELKRRKVFTVAATYAIVGWLLIQVATNVFPTLQLPDWTVTFVTAVIILGFPVALVLAWAYELTPDGVQPDERDLATQADGGPKRGVAGYFVTAIAAGAFSAGGFWLVTADDDARWLREDVVPQLEAHIEAGKWEAAYALAKEAEARVPDAPELEALWPQFAYRVTIPSEPAGATVYRRPYESTAADWQELGVTPLEDVHVPFGLSRLRFELEGYAPLLRTLGGGPLFPTELAVAVDPSRGLIVRPEIFKIDRAGTLPEGKVRVPGWEQAAGGETMRFRDFFLDRYEVTNAEFKAFVDAGGYERANLWDPVMIDGEVVPWADAMQHFTDRTGRPGPSTWSAGDYAEDEDDFPVAGVSWYEARAYARYVGEELPTVHHWSRAFAPTATLTWLLPASNLEGSGLRSVTESRAMTYAGAFDVTGNVREWTASAAASGDERVILGGSWKDPYYIATAEYPTAAPLDRSEVNGFRLAITNDAPTVAAWAREPVEVPGSDTPPQREPVSEEIYEAYSRVFAYEKSALNASVDATEPVHDGRRERISFDPAYGNERVILYLFLPEAGRPPYQTVVYWPGAGAANIDSFEEYPESLNFLLKTGRAVAFPVYEGTFERGGGSGVPPFSTVAYRDNLINGVKDLRRSIDYLETRPDIDSNALAFFGHSWGGANGPSVLAQEPRIRAAIIYVGFLPRAAPPEADPVNALPRVDVPTLMLSGQFDNLIPLDNARRYFELIGTDEKDHVIAPGGHFVPRDRLIRETLDWLDTHLGPATRRD